ncbi:MAG: hypothetical protein M3N38_04490 [Pseudomonadota bacterium]|nr:hypothetical protein [Pseudomonadota bacterium]
MSIEQATAFLNDWVIQHVHSVAHPQNNMEAKRLADLCVAEAERQGISKTELEQCCRQDLVKTMCDAQVAVADVEIGGFDDDDSPSGRD